MKRVIYPPLLKVFLGALFWVLILPSGMYFVFKTVSNWFDPSFMDAFQGNYISIAVMILGNIGFLLAFLFLIICGIWYHFSYCRFVIWDSKGIQQGILFPSRIIWAEKPFIGTAPMMKVPKSPRAGAINNAYSHFYDTNMIFVVSNDYKDTGVEEYGIAEVWCQMVLKKLFPPGYRLISKIKKKKIMQYQKDPKHYTWAYVPAPELTVPLKMIWVSYSPERYKELVEMVNPATQSIE